MPLFTHLLAFATVALVTLSSFPAHADALAPNHVQAARHIQVHDAVARRRRDASSSSTCKPRPTTTPPTPSSTSSSTSTPPASSTPSTTSAAPSPTSTGSPQKMGLAWTIPSDYLSNFKRPRVKFFHNWSSIVPAEQLAQLDIEPLLYLWGWKDADTFKQNAVPGHAHIAGGPNEPDQSGESNMDPGTAVELWLRYLEPLKAEGYDLFGPCCTDSPDAKAWYQQFYDQCWQRGCQIDYMCVHAYNTDTQYIIDYLNWLYDTFRLPIMVTEAADQDFTPANQQASLDEIFNFADTMVQFVDSTSWMVAYFPFTVSSSLDNVNPLNALLNQSTYFPTPLGYTYFG